MKKSFRLKIHLQEELWLHLHLKGRSNQTSSFGNDINGIRLIGTVIADSRNMALISIPDGSTNVYGENEIIFGDYNGVIHIYNADGTEYVSNGFPFDTGSQIWGSATSADLDGDGYLDFVIPSKSNISIFLIMQD